VNQPALSLAALSVLQSVPLLARVAAAAEGMTVGTAILLLTLLNPVEVAENAATLEAIAGGRLSWAVVVDRGRALTAVSSYAFSVREQRAVAEHCVVQQPLIGLEALGAEGGRHHLSHAPSSSRLCQAGVRQGPVRSRGSR
jgi:alkanesulfonate monooxygenase SsuD/methylene tetrahydromethanopterin reductase-like flavin-dependent oxidoreductase (luciferase family)